ncbi:carbohydrate kinase family protein [Porticoccus sp. W117]|uniref:carbohydrate kinase family protein n=1 Tax=Porticoccus sp. W117 TaxID=3054777 RepID=UPI0025934E0E|nr:carbohydrate kinase family protein [Porticoccus sp. W117]MDM3872355.1 carbohydrate kinase family protein [Porticoccus sp. W117]
MPTSILVCGSISYDTIMEFPDRFQNHMLSGDSNLLNLAFHVTSLRREFGGCAANICYNMKMLGCNAVPVATVGSDFSSYSQWLSKNSIPQKYINIAEDCCTAQDFITSDIDNNQIATFYPGAMDYACKNRLQDLEDVSIGVISPDSIKAMREHALDFENASIPFLFDPGQTTPLFNEIELTTFIEKADWAIFNAYEWQVFQEKTNLNHGDVCGKVKALIVTAGSEGSTIYHDDKVVHVPSAKVSFGKDPTGCGDAYRAGLLFGVSNNLDWETCGRIASVMGAYSYESQGSQNHCFTPSEAYERYSHNYGENKPLLIALQNVHQQS